MIRSKYTLSDTGHIEAAGQPAGRPAGRPTKCVSSKNEDFNCELEKKRDFLKIEKMPQKATFVRRNRFKNEKNLYDIFCSTGTPHIRQLCRPLQRLKFIGER